jgi:hypothetical protein
MKSRINLFQLRSRARTNRPCGVGRAFERAIVNDDRHTVSRQVHVAFHTVGTAREPAFECHQRVFGGEFCPTAVRKDQACGRPKD